jgi:hypothetical protein
MRPANPKPRELIDKLNTLAAKVTSAQELMADIAKLFHQKMLNTIGWASICS